MDVENVKSDRKPVFVRRVSDVKLVAWENVNGDGVKSLSLNLEKIYKKDDKWFSTKSFGLVDIDKIVFLLTESKRSLFPVVDDLRKKDE